MAKFNLKKLTNPKFILGKAGRFFQGLGNDPYFDWVLVLVISSAAALILVAFGIFLFVRVDAGRLGSSSSVSDSSAPNPSLDTVRLNKLVNTFATKKTQETTYRAGYPGPADPSK